MVASSPCGIAYDQDETVSTGGMPPRYVLMTLPPTLVMALTLARIGGGGYMTYRASRAGTMNIDMLLFGIVDLLLTFIVLGIMMSTAVRLW